MKKRVMKRWLSAFLAAIMVFSGMAYDLPVVNATAADYASGDTTVSEGGLIYVGDETESGSAYSDDATEDDLLYEEADDVPNAGAGDYGLCDNVKDGVILHAWNWSFKQIQQELPKIAEAGFTTVQTSPIQPNKDGSNVANTGDWWKFYQPVDFVVCSNNSGNISKLGTRQEFIDLCKEADKYGIKIIVDIVANHLANTKGSAEYPPGQYNSKEDRSNQIPSSIRDNDSYWHWPDDKAGSDDGNRWQMTRGQIGMPDLNTGNEELQDYIIKFLIDVQECGAAGFRFDAAKHIETPSDQGFGSQFWAKVKTKTQEKDPNVFLYGEILNTAGPGNYSDMQRYTPYIRVTNNEYANSLRSGIKNKNADYAKFTNNDKFGSNGNEWVLWNESHDTYAGDYGEFTDQNFTDEEMALAWCAVAARTSPALYFCRPTSMVGRKVWAGVSLGSHTNMYQDSRIAAVNKFHNHFAGTTEYVTTNNNVLVVERGTEGVVLINFSRGSKSVSIPVNKMQDGTYVDQVTKSTFTVSNKTLTGNIGDGGVAAIYNAQPVVKKPMPTISKEGGNFSSDTLSLTIGLKGSAISGTYKIGSQAAETYTSSKPITIGSDMAFGDSVTIVLTATDGSTTETKTYTFTKVEQTGNVVYLSLPSGWSTPVYCYAFIHGKKPVVENAGWPGVAMTFDDATEYYKYEIPEAIENPEVILHDGMDGPNRTSPDQQPGKVIDGSWLYKDGSWQEYTPTPPRPTTGKVIVKHVDESGKSVADQQTLTGTVGTAYNTAAASPAGYELKTKPSNAAGKYTAADITVTYVYKKVQENVLSVASSLAEGSEFTTETTTITLTAQNATSATYCVDDGPVKTFSGSAQVVIGQGKIADSQVEVKVTATNGTDTVSKTFTYNKKFSGKVANETADNLPRAASMQSEEAVRSGAAGTLASQYATNKTGVGVEKTISIDGSISDWDSSMLIAQGAANDDPRVYRPNSMYEVAVDLYALYGAYDDNNVYLMWEMTNVQDVVAPNDNYPLAQGILWQTVEFPFFIAVDTGKSDVVGKKGATTTGGTIWNSGMTIENRFNKLISINTKGGNGPFVYGGDADGLNAVELLGPGAATPHSNVKMGYGKGILSQNVKGINGAYGENNNRVVGDIYNDSADWVDFNTKNHSSATMDFFYELSIPYDELGITKNDVKQNGIGVLLVGTMGKSAMDCLPYDGSMNDNADLDDSAGSQENNSFEKSDEDHITCSFARIGKAGNSDPITDPITDPTADLTVNFGADRSSPQLNTTSLTLKAIASGGKSAYSYEFFVDGASVQSKSSKDTYTWNPSPGNHTIKVTVTDSAGKTVSSQKAYAIEGKVEPGAPVVGSFTANPAGSIYTGNSVSLTAAATGGTGALQYKFTAQLENGAESVIRDYETSPSVTWTPQTAGKYTLKVTVKDAANKSGTKSIAGYTVTDNVTVDIRVSFADATKKYVYDGKEKKPEVVVKDGAKTLTRNTDYTVSYINNINACDAQASENPPTVIITGKNTYSGKIHEQLTFTIAKVENSLPPEAPADTMNAKAGLVKDVRLDSGWEWLESDKNKEIPSGQSIEVTAVYNGPDKDNYANTTKKVTLTGIECQHSDTAQHVEKIITPATCTENGHKEIICMVCRGKVRDGEEIPKLGHIGGTATCTKPAVCARCGKSYGFIDSNNHVDTIVYGQKKANCQQSGYTGDIKCTACGAIVSQGRPIPQTSHNWDGGKVTKPATATADGIRTFTCTVCQKTRTEVIPKIGGGGQGTPTDPVPTETVKTGDSVTDVATQAKYKVTKADSTGKTVEFVAPTGASSTVKIPNTIAIKGTNYQVTSVADNAFKNNKVVQTVQMGSNVKTIGKNAFSGCSKLKKVTLSKNTTTIGNNAFYKCVSLTSITIPAKVSKIGSKAFYGCKKLKKITIKTTKLTTKKVGSKAFKGIAAKATIKVPKKKLAPYKKMLKARGVGSKAKIKK